MSQPTQNPRTPLTVFKASAGSGKTFTLAVEYIKLLIENPLYFRHILAVTFTNKATEEMKMRILSQLNGLAHGYEDSNDYLEKISKELGVDERLVRSRAQQALTSIIHDYSSFRVETIDKFFQRVLRNLARELDLSANLRIELNDRQVEQLAVDTMIESLDQQNPMLQWVMSYILENIGNDKGWNIIKKVKRFGENIFKDTYKVKRKALEKFMSDPKDFDNVRNELRQTRAKCLSVMKNHADQFFTAIEGYDGSNFAHNTSGIYGFFCNLRQGKLDPSMVGKRVLSCLNSPESWVTKTSPTRQDIIRLAEQKLISILGATINDLNVYARIYKSVSTTEENLNQLRLLGNIEATMHTLNSESSRFLLSDTQAILKGMINGSDSPFIFEKIGAPLQSIMIDEFQDTGALQWHNFKVLLDDCMSKSKGNLIVGDVKQSIYRWRDGDWRLLNNITSEFANDKSMVTVQPLDTNYRSSRRVIEFNNEFFTLATKAESDRLLEMVGGEAHDLSTAYSDVVQFVPEWRPSTGYVRIEMMEKETYESTIMEHLADTIHQLLDNGIPQSKIAILSRYNRDIENTANYFQLNDPDVHIVSDEAFRLDSSLAVRIIINAMRLLVNVSDGLCAATLAKTYQDAILGTPDADYLFLSSASSISPPKEKAADSGAVLGGDNNTDSSAVLGADNNTDQSPTLLPFAELLPEGFQTPADLARLRGLPLTDMAEAIYSLFGLEQVKGQSAYICAFYDKLAEFLKDNPSDIDRFLTAWDDNLFKEKIHGDQVDGVRMVSIHKSKGLEYDNVIIPFCSWEMEKTGYVVWCETDEKPFDMLPILPINYAKSKMVGTVYEKDYNHEHLQNSVDNLNMLYVAFTRAKKRLFVMGKMKEEKKGSTSTTPSVRTELVCDVLPQLVEKLPGSKLEKDDQGGQIFEYGDCFETEEKKESKKSDNVFLQPEEGKSFAIRSYPSRAKFRQSNSSREFTTTEEAALLRTEYINRGSLLHTIFSRLRDIDDIERVLQQLTHEGVLYDEIPEAELRPMLQRVLSNPKVKVWFSPRWQLHNECTILYKDPATGIVKECRPDRVMTNGTKTIVVDYKFGNQNPEHQKQVRAYMQHLAAMGHPQVEGYLWYVSRNKVVRVEKQQ